jgi:heme O synthase-like polyprenyltransferase
MSANHRIASRQIWILAAWLAIAALMVVGIALKDVSIAIGAAVAGVWALCFGFPASADRT